MFIGSKTLFNIGYIGILAKCHVAATLFHVTGRISVLKQNIWIRLYSKKHGKMVIINVADS